MSRRRRWLWNALVLLSLSAPVAPPASVARAAESNSAPLRFRYADGSSEEIATREAEGEALISILDVSRIFASVMDWQSDFFQMELPVEGRRVRLTLGTPVAIVDGAAVHLATPVQIVDGVLWVPLRFLTDNLLPLSPNRAEWVAARNEVRIGGASTNVTRLRTDMARDGVSIEIDTTAPLDADARLTRSRELTIRLRGAVMPAGDVPVDDRRQIIESADALGEADGGTLVLRLAFDFESAFVTSHANPPRSVVHLGVRADSTSAPDDDRSHEDESERSSAEATGEESDDWAEVRTLIIDPGHGGADRGCASVSGGAEKDLALAFALALRERAEQRLGLRTILTREIDETLAPERRATIANTSDGDFLVSVHCNAASDPDANGIELYVYDAAGSASSAASAPYASAAAARADLLATDGELRILPWRFAQIPFLEESRRFADALGRGLHAAEPLHFRGVRRGTFTALEGARMPAVHIELGFLTHAPDEAALSSDAFRSDLADAIVTGIEEYMNEPTP